MASTMAAQSSGLDADQVRVVQQGIATLLAAGFEHKTVGELAQTFNVKQPATGTWRNIRYGEKESKRLAIMEKPSRRSRQVGGLPLGARFNVLDMRKEKDEVWLMLMEDKWVLAKTADVVNCVDTRVWKDSNGAVPQEAFAGQAFPHDGMFTEGYAGRYEQLRSRPDGRDFLVIVVDESQNIKEASARPPDHDRLQHQRGPVRRLLGERPLRQRLQHQGHRRAPAREGRAERRLLRGDHAADGGADVQEDREGRAGEEAAMAANDTAGVSRFAKLFHPLGLAGEGVLKYVQFIRRSLAETCAKEFKQLALAKRTAEVPTPYAEVLTQVFVGIADIIQAHQQSVEQEFGLENFLVVLRGLLEEADLQGMKVIDKFAKDGARVFDRQSACEVREVGAVLEETAVATQRTQQFHAYAHGVGSSVVELIADREAFAASLPPEHNEDDGLPKLSGLMRRVQELVSSYVCVEQSNLLQSVEKAVRETDSLDPTDPEQLTTTLVDDVFFILQQSMLRSISTCDINAVCAVVNHVSAAVSGELRTALLGNLAESRRLYKDWVSYPKNIAPPAAGEHPLATLFLDSEGKLRSPLTAASSWPHSLNNLEQALEYLDKLKSTTQEAFDEFFPPDGPDKDKRVMFQHCITALDASKAELESLHAGQCKDGLTMLKPHLRPPLDPLTTIDYNINEAQYADFQVNDPFARDFNTKATVVHQHVKAVLNAGSCEEIMQQMAEQTCRRIEKDALGKRFSLFGALQFESDIRALCSFFTNVSDQALRHKFARLFEMASLLTLESASELRELYGEIRSWRLAPDEARKLLLSRVDFEISEKDLDLILPS